MNVDYGENATDYIITMTNSNTEYSLLLPEGVKAIEVQCRDATDVRMAFVPGKVAGATDPFRTLKAGTVYKSDKLYLNATTLYVACGSGSKIVEVRVWQ